MKKYLENLISQAESGRRKVDGRYLSERRISTYKRVAAITPEIAPGEGSAQRIEKLVENWRGMGMKESTIKVYLEVLKMVPGKYTFPKIKVEPKEPQHLPVAVAERILSDPIPDWVDTPALRALWTATKLSLSCALRPGDSLNVTKDNISGEFFVIFHQKRNRIVRGSLHPDVARHVAKEIEAWGDVYPPEFTRKGLNYRKAQFMGFIKQLLIHYGIADDTVFDTAAGKVKKLKLKDVITPHSLRATAVAILQARRVPESSIKALGGWSQNSQIFSRHYVKPDTENIWK